MKLPVESLSVDERMEEFDQWMTPQLQKIKDTEKFALEILKISRIIEGLAPHLNSFQEEKDCSLQSIRDSILLEVENQINSLSNSEAENAMDDILSSFFSLLFLVTGATDNNLKNHFTIKLKQDGIDTNFPEKTGRKNIKFKLKKLGNTISYDDFSKKLSRAYVASFNTDTSVKIAVENGVDLQEVVRLFLLEYIALILNDEEDLQQFWVICKAYCDLKNIHPIYSKALLNPLTLFKVRGSVSASAGHLPETILKEKLEILGLKPGVDFNTSDVVVGQENIEENGEVTMKTRAYDFVLPFATPTWERRIFIQAQFYAGDSGSVSHKVVDQTVSSRQYTLLKYPNARFVEYLDGAGYFAALRTDLLHMMSMENTHSFLQVRSIWVRLRREFQQIGFITPIEIEHAIFQTPEGHIEEVKELLKSENYSDAEITRGISYALENRFISIEESKFQVDAHRLIIARRLFIIDIIAKNGVKLTNREEINKAILIPGFGVSFGVNFVDLSKEVEDSMKYSSITVTEYNQDIEWLMDEKVIKRLTL